MTHFHQTPFHRGYCCTEKPDAPKVSGFLLSSSNVAIESHGVTEGVTLGNDLPLSPVTPKSAADMPLTDAFLRPQAPPRPEKHSDSGGLFILATLNGVSGWRLGTDSGVKEKLLHGDIPEVGLKAARDRRDEACALAGGRHRPRR